MNKILFVSSEAQPLIKTGGLADVSGALPVALQAAGCDIRLMLPAYADLLAKLGQPRSIASLRLPGLPGKVELLEDTLPGSTVKVILVHYAPAFDRPGNPYLAEDGQPWPDNAERFALLARAACEVAMNRAGLDWQPDVVHCNDWQTGLVPALLHNEAHDQSLDDALIETQRPATLFTIHNLAYQGLFPHSTFTQLGIPEHLWSPDALEFHDQLSFIKGGLVFADRINTVSPRYAEEIQTPRFGYGLEGLLQYRSPVLSGIINGIDDREWNPATDPHIDKRYDSESLHQKSDNKIALQQHFNLPVKDNVMLCGFIGRLVEQKGIDLIIEAMTSLTGQAVQFVFLGSGEHKYESDLQAICKRHPDQIGVTIGYNETLAHKIEAGVDVFLMPSRFEPCGLNQLYSLRYGSLPIVHRVGGLADSVTDTSKTSLANKTATGFVFDKDDSTALLDAIERAIKLFKKQDDWRAVMRTGMNRSFNWQASAKQYLKLYQAAIGDIRQTSQPVVAADTAAADKKTVATTVVTTAVTTAASTKAVTAAKKRPASNRTRRKP